jgi:hypothetical protein
MMDRMTVDPSKILAIIVIIGMILGPWILHEKTLSRVEYKLDSLEYKVSGLESQAAENKAVLAERKRSFEQIINELEQEVIKQKGQP